MQNFRVYLSYSCKWRDQVTEFLGESGWDLERMLKCSEAQSRSSHAVYGQVLSHIMRSALFQPLCLLFRFARTVMFR